MKLTGQQLEHFSNALRAAFGVDELQRMLKYRLDKELEDYSSLAKDKQQIIFDLLMTAEQEGWILTLLRAAREANRGNAELQVFARSVGMMPAGLPEARELEKMVSDVSMLDITAWRARLGDIEAQVCMVEIGPQPVGTGFLVGPDLVMTNYHVVEDVHQGSDGLTPASVALRFDFKRLADGTTINPGIVHRLVDGEGWLVDHSPYSALDTAPAPAVDEHPAPTELDYALLRVAGTPGRKPAGSDRAIPNERPRGWISVSAAKHAFTPGSPLYIVQHPLGQTIKLALDTRAIIGINDETVRTRVRYRTNTDHGSSGSPCFDHDWRPVALHHSGDAANNITPTWNEGIPLDTIFRLLEQRGKAGELSQPLP